MLISQFLGRFRYIDQKFHAPAFSYFLPPPRRSLKKAPGVPRQKETVTLPFNIHLIM